jgi:hypothetical protein
MANIHTNKSQPKGINIEPMLLNKIESSQLTEQEILFLLTQITSHIENASTNEGISRDVIEWLSILLISALVVEKESLVQRVCNIIYQLAVENQESFLVQMRQSIRIGEYKGQMSLNVLLDALYTTTFQQGMMHGFLAINIMLEYILDSIDYKLIMEMVKPIDTKKNQGGNGLLLMMQALLQAAKTPFNQPQTTTIVQSISKLFYKYPKIIGSTITQIIKTGAYEGKSLIYMFTRVLTHSVKDNIDATIVVADLLIQVIKIQPKKKVYSAFYDTIGNGKYKGLSTSYLILISLVRASYIDDNSEVIQQINRVLTVLEKQGELSYIKAMTYIIDGGEHINESAVMLLVQALIASSEHHLDNSLTLQTLLKLVAFDNLEISNALTHKTLQNKKYNDDSPLSLLLKRANQQEKRHDSVELVVATIARSKYKAKMQLLLPLALQKLLNNYDSMVESGVESSGINELATKNKGFIESKVSPPLDDENP